MNIWRVAVLIGVVWGAFSFTHDSSSRVYHVINIDKIGPEELDRLKQNQAFEWWTELDDQMLVLSEEYVLDLNQSYQTLPVVPKPERLYLVRNGHSRDLNGLDADILASGGKSSVIQSRSDKVPDLSCLQKDKGSNMPHSHAGLFIFEPNRVLVKQSKNSYRIQKKKLWNQDAPINLEALDVERWLDATTKLSSFHRNTKGEGIIDARNWLVDELGKLPGVEVSLQEFSVGNTMSYNVIAKLVGSQRPDEWYVVGGHYDSTSEDPLIRAPGAEDNASGSAGVLEMARVFAENPPAATVFFIFFSGEEQNLYGSKAHVERLIEEGDADKLKGVINMDMIGYAKGDTLGVLLETEEVATELMQLLEDSAAEFTDMEVSTTFNAWGSDHVPYLRKQIPAVLTIDRDWSGYPSYHKTTDTIEKVRPDMAAEILKMNVAALSQLAGLK